MPTPPFPQRILVAHNAYQQRGGEDAVVEAEVALLRAHGHEVQLYQRSNDDIHGMSKASAALQTLWSGRTQNDAAALFAQFQPQVLHVHNTFLLISPTLYWAATVACVPENLALASNQAVNHGHLSRLHPRQWRFALPN